MLVSNHNKHDLVWVGVPGLKFSVHNSNSFLVYLFFSLYRFSIMVVTNTLPGSFSEVCVYLQIIHAHGEPTLCWFVIVICA